MTYDEQLAQWVEGRPAHGNQCCPDFSCCRPELLAPESVRKIFMAAHRAGNENVTTRMLMEFLSKALAGSHEIHIAGLEASRREEAENAR